MTLSGTLIGSEEAQVAAGAAGKVIATYVERGSVVRKGAVLARLDSRAASAQAAQAAADAEGSKIQAQQAKLDCDRTEHMFQKGAISKADYDRAHTQCESSKWTVSSAEARKTLTAEALRDTEIRAPFSGMVVDRAVSAGEYVQPASRVATLVDVDSLRVEITVPEADVASVRQGMLIDFRTSGAAQRQALSRQDPLRRAVGAAPEPRRDRRGGVHQRDARAAPGHVRDRADGARRAEAARGAGQGGARRRRAEARLRRDAGRLEDRLVQAGEPRRRPGADCQRPQVRANRSSPS